MDEFTFANIAPLATFIGIIVVIWGASRKFTSVDITNALNSKEIQTLKEELCKLRSEYDKLNERFIEFRTRAEDKLK